jgi:hypothetical protein
MIESSLLSLQNSINQISQSNRIEYSQVKQDLHESFQSLFLNFSAMMEQYSNQFQKIPTKMNLEESLLKLFDQRNSKNETNTVEKLSKQIINNFELSKRDLYDHIRGLLSQFGNPLESHQRLQLMIESN